MQIEIFLALLVFAFTTSITPGPNNMMLFASGVNFGFVRTIPHMCGIGVGFLVLLLAVGFGLGALLETVPLVYTVLKFAGGAYLVWIAWKIGTSRSLGESAGATRPMSFLEAAAFQWVNPKAWVMAIGAVSTYAAISDFPLNMIAIATVFGTLGTISAIVWVLFGTALKRFITDRRAVRIFNLTMAGLLVLSLVPVFLEG